MSLQSRNSVPDQTLTDCTRSQVTMKMNSLDDCELYSRLCTDDSGEPAGWTIKVDGLIMEADCSYETSAQILRQCIRPYSKKRASTALTHQHFHTPFYRSVTSTYKKIVSRNPIFKNQTSTVGTPVHHTCTSPPPNKVKAAFSLSLA
jgi:hypothetical protein